MQRIEMEYSNKNTNINSNRVLLAVAIVFLSIIVVPYVLENFFSNENFGFNIRFYVGGAAFFAVLADRLYVKYVSRKGKDNA